MRSRAGLAPGLAPGSALIARAIISEDGTRYSSDPVWSKRLSSALGAAAVADIAGVDAPLAGHEEKHALHMKTGAPAADMESHIAARIAAADKLPFAAYRIVADSAHRRLPHAALVALKPDGSFALGAIAESILRDPSQISQLLRMPTMRRWPWWLYSAAESCLPEPSASPISASFCSTCRPTT